MKNNTCPEGKLGEVSGEPISKINVLSGLGLSTYNLNVIVIKVVPTEESNKKIAFFFLFTEIDKMIAATNIPIAITVVPNKLINLIISENQIMLIV